MVANTGIWPKKITVDSKIVTILSGATYDNFPKALKEIITNSYDADASEVRITIDERGETITVEDNGWGLSESDFDFYLRIAGKSRTSRELTISGRKRIGQFGVGFLAVFPFCRNYNIESKKKG
jgi:HSP90 family molecular chaperone